MKTSKLLCLKMYYKCSTRAIMDNSWQNKTFAEFRAARYRRRIIATKLYSKNYATYNTMQTIIDYKYFANLVSIQEAWSTQNIYTQVSHFIHLLSFSFWYWWWLLCVLETRDHGRSLFPRPRQIRAIQIIYRYIIYHNSGNIN